MKRVALLFLASSFLSTALACGELANGKGGCKMAAASAWADAQVEVDAAEGTKALLTVSGMHCDCSANSVKAAMLGVEGVRAVAVDVSVGEAKVAFDAGKTNLDAIIAKVSEAGAFEAVAKAN
jgi:copper chaperone CopZ